MFFSTSATKCIKVKQTNSCMYAYDSFVFLLFQVHSLQLEILTVARGTEDSGLPQLC